MYVNGSTKFNICDFGSWRVLFTIALWPVINVTVKKCHQDLQPVCIQAKQSATFQFLITIVFPFVQCSEIGLHHI